MSEPTPTKSYADSVADLRALANRWVMLARDHARDAKTHSEAGNAAKAGYARGVAETYYKLALELADVVKTMAASSEPSPANDAPPATVAEAPTAQYAPVPLSEAMRLLDYAGVSARDIKQHKDNVFSAVFSRWQPFSQPERLERMKSADARIVILAHGKLPDSYDLYVDFAFRAE